MSNFENPTSVSLDNAPGNQGKNPSDDCSGVLVNFVRLLLSACRRREVRLYHLLKVARLTSSRLPGVAPYMPSLHFTVKCPVGCIHIDGIVDGVACCPMYLLMDDN